MPHFHIPLQSGCDKILALMRRRYNTAMFARKIERVKELFPDVFIGIDVIVGFPGETEEDFEITYRLLEKLEPAFLHIFPYSMRADTDAILFDGKVSPKESERRVARLAGLSSRLHRSFAERFVGRTATVLVEGTRKGGEMFGYTENYIRCRMPYRKGCIGEIVPVRIESVDDDGSATVRCMDSL